MLDTTKKIINLINKYENPCLIIDFDHTITTFSSKTSIGVYKNYLGKTFKEKKEKLDYYYHKTKSKTIVKIIWFYKLKLLKKYYKKIDVKKHFKIRKEFIELFKYIKQNNIKLIICSSGFDETINTVLSNIDINYTLITNSLNTKFNHLITPYNKNVSIKNYDVILIGDNELDTKMHKNPKLTIGIKQINTKTKFDEVIIVKE